MRDAQDHRYRRLPSFAELPSHLFDLCENLGYDVVILCCESKEMQESRETLKSVLQSKHYTKERERTTENKHRQLIQDGYYRQKDRESSGDPDIYVERTRERGQ
jgi:hypothetical protein